MKHYNQKHHKFIQYQERNYIKDATAIYARAAEMVEAAENAEDMNRMGTFVETELFKIRSEYLFQIEEYFALNTVSSEDMHNSITKALTEKINRS